MANSSATLPYNYGETYFDSSYHCNIEIVLKDGNKIKANSIVLAANSPIFKEMIEKNNSKSIEMDDFDPVTSKMFLKSLYTGYFGPVDKELFSQLSKLSYTFQVSWLKEKCLEYFKQLMNAVMTGTNSYDNDKFLLKVAIAAKAFDKDGQYLDILAQKKTSEICSQDIESARIMLKEFDSLPLDQIDFYIQLANNCIRFPLIAAHNHYCVIHCAYEIISKEYSTVIVHRVIEHLGKLEKLDTKTRYVLKNLDFRRIRLNFFLLEEHYTDNFKLAASKLFQNLLELGDISNEDMKMTLKHFMSLA